MPQMAPIWWTKIMALTMMMILLLMIKLFFNKNTSMTMKKSMKKINVMTNWKW